ncbi:MAG: glycosyltransferase family 2 protein [Promethearchaeota archaeon]
MPTPGSVLIVVVNWRDYNSTERLTGSLLRLDYPNREIVIVDNNSRDGSFEKLTSAFPDLVVLANPVNNGYAGGINLALREMAYENYDYVLILNDDLIVEPYALTELVNVASGNDRIGIVSPKIKVLNTNRFEHAGCLLDLKSGKPILRGAGKEDVGQFDRNAVVDYTGIGLVRSKVFKEVGAMDESYFLYGEDSDFCLRAKSAGFSTVYAYKALFWNTNVPSRLGVTYYPQKLYYITRNNFLLLRKFGTPGEMLSQTLLKTFGMWTYILLFVREYPIRKFPGLMKAYLLGLFDGIKILIGGAKKARRRY